jgi:hypothetical protein
MTTIKITLELEPNHAAALHQLCRKLEEAHVNYWPWIDTGKATR